MVRVLLLERQSPSACAKAAWNLGHEPSISQNQAVYEPVLGRPATGQLFTFRQLDQRRLMSAEADQAHWSRECQEATFSVYGQNFAEGSLWQDLGSAGQGPSKNQIGSELMMFTEALQRNGLHAI